MRALTKEQLQEVLEKHKLWLADEGGERAKLGYVDFTDAQIRFADLRHADFRGADFTNADLRNTNFTWSNFSGANFTGADLGYTRLIGANLENTALHNASLDHCTGNRREIKNISFIEDYDIAYTATHLQIDYRKHVIDDWWGFAEHEIRLMDGERLLKFWGEWKDTIKTIIEKSPAKKTGKE